MPYREEQDKVTREITGWVSDFRKGFYLYACLHTCVCLCACLHMRAYRCVALHVHRGQKRASGILVSIIPPLPVSQDLRRRVGSFSARVEAS